VTGWNSVSKTLFSFSSWIISNPRTTIKYQNCMHEEIKIDWTCGMLTKFRSGILCLPLCYSKFKDFKYVHSTVVLSVLLRGCETWSLALREEQRLMVFDSRMLRKIFGPKTDAVGETGGKCIMRSSMICAAHKICGRGVWHAWSRGEEHTESWWWGNLRKRDDLEDLDVV